MATTNRYIDTRFWSDVWVRKLNALDRYVFLYFLTNQHSTWCGVYEVDLSMVAFETGVDVNDLTNSILPRLAPKIIYIDGWVYIQNFEKYHANGSEKTQKGIKAAWDEVPDYIRLKIKEIEQNTIPHTRGIQGVSPSTSTSTSTSTPSACEVPSTPRKKVVVKRSDTKRSNMTPVHNPLGAEVIKQLESVDAKNKLYYGNTTQRAACDFLLSEYGMDEIRKRIEVLPKTNTLPYFPKIYTPVQLRDNWQRLGDHVQTKRNEIISKQPQTVGLPT